MNEVRKGTAVGRRSFGAVTAWIVLALLLVFAGISVALIALGGQAYRAILASADENAQRRASVGYVLGRIHAFDAQDSVRVERMMLDGEALDVLILGEDIEGEQYETRIYCAKGLLREQFVSADIGLEAADDGEVIAALAQFEAEQKEGLIQLRFTHPDGELQTLHAALHSEQEG